MSNTQAPVRILPMDRRGEFGKYDSVEAIQDEFFFGEFARRPDGKYCFYKKGLIAKPGTIVLFQCDGRIIASAILHDCERFDQPDGDGYQGCLHFDVTSIEVFDPVTKDALGIIWPEVKRLGRVKWSLDPKRYHKFRSKLKHIRQPNV